MSYDRSVSSSEADNVRSCCVGPAKLMADVMPYCNGDPAHSAPPPLQAIQPDREIFYINRVIGISKFQFKSRRSIMVSVKRFIFLLLKRIKRATDNSYYVYASDFGQF